MAGNTFVRIRAVVTAGIHVDDHAAQFRNGVRIIA